MSDATAPDDLPRDHRPDRGKDHSAAADEARRAVLYRMATPDHLCPYGNKTKAFLQAKGYEVEDHLLTSREETEAFKQKEGVKTTPQTYIDGERIGGYEDVRAYLDLPVKGGDETTYQPVIALFGMAAVMTLALALGSMMPLWSPRGLEVFIAFAMCLLALQKLRDIESFSTMFLNYDLLARRWVWYGYIYPVAEALAGLLMLAALGTIAAPIAIVIGGIGAVSVIKAVYIDRRELKCACMGGASDVPLGFVSLTENLMMVFAGLWMLLG
eukprot:g16981.t1